MTNQDVRTRMVEATVRLLATKGLEGTSFAEILAAADAPRGSVYHHFPGGKSQLIEAALHLVDQRSRAAMDGVGLAFMSEEHAEPHFTTGVLARVLEDWCQPFPGFFLYYPSRRQQSAALSALIKTLRL